MKTPNASPTGIHVRHTKEAHCGMDDFSSPILYILCIGGTLVFLSLFISFYFSDHIEYFSYPIMSSALISDVLPYHNQRDYWPKSGRMILAHYDDRGIIVYQAFNSAIAKFVVDHQTFVSCPEYSTTRMTWIKTNFLWMMYRSAWGTKDKDQERVLAIKLSHDGFREILSLAVDPSNPLHRNGVSFHRACKNEGVHEDGPVASPTCTAKLSPDERNQPGVRGVSVVRLQWDPDHTPSGSKLERRAIQLGVKGPIAARMLSEFIIGIQDVTDVLVAPQWPLVLPTAIDKQLIGRNKTAGALQLEEQQGNDHVLFCPVEVEYGPPHVSVELLSYIGVGPLFHEE